MYGMGEQNQNQPYGYNQNYSPYQMNPLGASDVLPGKKRKKWHILVIIMVVLLLAAAGLFAIGMIIQNNDKKESSEVLDTFIEGYNNQNFDEAYDTFHPYIRQQIKQNALDSNYVTDGEEFFELYDFYFGGLHVEYEINESEKLSEDDIQSLVSQIYSVYGVRMELDKAYAYEITETYSGSNGTMVQIETVIVGKDNDNWYIVAASTNEVVSNTLGY